MSVLRAIKTSLGVQLNRAAFLVYAIFFAWPLWHFRHPVALSGLVILGSFVFCSLLGLGCSFIRFSRSRWILAVLGHERPVINTTVAIGYDLKVPEVWSRVL